MSDVFTKEKRSEVMSRIRGKGNRDTELVLARLLREQHITGWRRHYPIPGRPDFAFPKIRVVVFVDGCFWHRCPKCSNMPSNNRRFWMDKLTGNVARDRKVNRAMVRAGWSVLRVWEHDLRRPDRVIGRIKEMLVEGRPTKGRILHTSAPRGGVFARSRSAC